MAAAVLALLVALFLIGPILVIVPMSFSTAISFQFPPPGYGLGYYERFFSDPDWLEPARNSFMVAAGTTVLSMVLVVPAALCFARRRFAGRQALNLLILLPLIVPPVAAAPGYYGFLSAIRLIGTPLGVVVAHTALAIPVVFLVVTAALKGFDPNLERAAMSAGAGPWRTFWHVTMPVLRPGLVVAALFAFLTSFNEAVIAIFIAGRDGTTLPKKMFESIRLESDPVVAVVSTLLTAAVALGVLSSFLRRQRPHAA